jgi:hypothetical protein
MTTQWSQHARVGRVALVPRKRSVEDSLANASGFQDAASGSD